MRHLFYIRMCFSGLNPAIVVKMLRSHARKEVNKIWASFELGAQSHRSTTVHDQMAFSTQLQYT